MSYATEVGDAMVEHYRQSRSLRKTAAEFKCSPNTIRHHLRQRGVVPNGVGGPKRLDPHRRFVVKEMRGGYRINPAAGAGSSNWNLVTSFRVIDTGHLFSLVDEFSGGALFPLKVSSAKAKANELAARLNVEYAQAAA